MSRIVPVRAGMKLSELETNVLKEFLAGTEIAPLPVLSYWPPNTKKLVTGVTTPPVIMTNDGALAYFFLHLEAHWGMNLFVTFESRVFSQQRSQVAENPIPFTKPNQPIKLNLNSFLDDDEETPSQSSQPTDTDGVPPAGYDHDFLGSFARRTTWRIGCSRSYGWD
ncbi:unnamed protein product [Brassica oleracea]